MNFFPLLREMSLEESLVLTTLIAIAKKRKKQETKEKSVINGWIYLFGKDEWAWAIV